MAKKPHAPKASSETQSFSEGQAKYEVTADMPKRWKLKVAADGRFVIPAAARAMMDIGEDGTITAVLNDGELKLVSPRVAIRKIQEIARKVHRGEGSVVDELIAERRAAAALGD